MRDVTDFGAVGDGKTKDTLAIQKALDAGGVVNFPPGVYLTGSIYLRSHGGIHLETGAVLKGSPDMEDYNAPDFCPQNGFSKVERAYGQHLVIAVEQQDVIISGHGTIDGSRSFFFDPTKYTRDNFPGWRPSQMIFLCECQGVTVENVWMTDAPYWACFLLGCEDVMVRGVTVRNQPGVWNGDGIDIDCCRRVIVSDCDISSSDDSLAIRASCVKRLQHSPGLSENIVVTNCILSSHQAAIRLGVGTGTIRDCVFSNIMVSQSHFGIVFLSTYLPDIFPDGAEGVEISNIMFENMVIHADVPFDLSCTWLYPPRKTSQKKISNVTFRSIRAYGSQTNLLQGDDDLNLSDIEFSDVMLWMTGGDDSILPPEHCMRDDKVYHRPWAFYILNTQRVRFMRTNCLWQNESDKWQGTVYMKNNPELNMIDCRFDAPKNGKAFIEPTD